MDFPTKSNPNTQLFLCSNLKSYLIGSKFFHNMMKLKKKILIPPSVHGLKATLVSLRMAVIFLSIKSDNAPRALQWALVIVLANVKSNLIVLLLHGQQQMAARVASNSRVQAERSLPLMLVFTLNLTRCVA